MMPQATYIEYLLSTPRNYTCTYLANHLPQVSYDQVNRFMRRSCFSPTQLRELVLPLCTTRLRPFYLLTTAGRTNATAVLLQWPRASTPGQRTAW